MHRTDYSLDDAMLCRIFGPVSGLLAVGVETVSKEAGGTGSGSRDVFFVFRI